MTTSQRFYQQLGEVLAQEPAVVATIVKVVGSAPREVGAKMAVYGEGSILGTIGGGAGEGKVIEQALIALKKRKEAKNRQIEIDLTVNGEAVQALVPAGQHAVDFLRQELGLILPH